MGKGGIECDAKGICNMEWTRGMRHKIKRRVYVRQHDMQ